LKRPGLTEIPVVHADPQAKLSRAFGDQRIERQHATRIAARAVGRELVLVLQKAG